MGMRRCRNGATIIDKDNGGKFIGVNMPGDYCAEHEWGIKPLIKLFDRDPARFKINGHAPYENSVKFLNKKDYAILGCDAGSSRLMDFSWLKTLSSETSKPELRKALAYYVDISAEFSGAWCEDEFIISVTGKEPVRQLGKLYDSICINDAAIWLGGGNSNPFDRGGLCLAVYSELKPEIIKAWEEAYVDNQKLKEAVAATGIEQKLKDAGKRYFALSPKWLSEEQRHRSQHPVVFWLNPWEQNIHNFGWFVVEELEQWINNEGPIVTKKDKK
jgi:hypothetical protein